MAYIATDDVRRIRNALKAAYPNLKFSVRKEDCTNVHVAILKGDLDLLSLFDASTITHYDVNPYHTHQYGKFVPLFEDILRIMKTAPEKQWYNNSDSMIDYFDIAYYIHLTVGRWNKPYEVTV